VFSLPYRREAYILRVFGENLPIFIRELITRWHSVVGFRFLSTELDNQACNLLLLFPGTCGHDVCRVPSCIVVVHKLERDTQLLLQPVDIFLHLPSLWRVV
jgi:hypothetical protein